MEINRKEVMNMKTSIFLGITIMLLLAIPAAASDYTLGVFGNANEDDTINMQDVTYTELIILEYRDATDLADAKYDGRINMQDVTQIELIILGRELEITLIDEVDRIVTVEKPVERMVVSYHATAGVIKAIGAEDKVVGVSSTIASAELLFPELSQLPSIGSTWAPDVESILALDPDLVLTITSGSKTETLAEQLEGTGISVIGAYCTSPLTYTETVEKLTYILNTRTDAEEYIDWYEGYTDLIKDRTEGLTEEDKPRVFGTYKYNEEWKTYGDANPGANQMIKMAGGINIAGDLPGGWITVDPEWVLEENPSLIFVQSGWSPHTFGYDVDDPSEAKAFREEFMSLPVFENVDAVENEEVYLLHGDSMVWRSWFIGQVYLAKWFHPELFEDLDPQAIHQEWLTEFQHIDYDLNEHGAFVYHPEKHPDGK